MIQDTHKARLEEMLIAITKELETLGIHNPDVSEDWIATPGGAVGAEADANTAADRVEDWGARRATLSTLETRYNNINRALAKIETGTYGTCEIGNETISDERLAANPAARTCTKHMDNESALEK